MNAPAIHAIHTLARPEVPPLPPYNAGLSSEAVRARYGVTEIARLASNENPFGASLAVARALADLALHVGTYPDAQCTALRAAIAARTGVPAEAIAVGNGSGGHPADALPGVSLARRPRAHPAPGLRPARDLPAHDGRPRRAAGADARAGLRCRCLVPALARGPKIAMLANPSNPVGCMFSAGDFVRLLDATPPQTLLVVDEAYYEYALHADGYPDVLTLLRGRAMPWIVLRTFSKAWGLAGLRVGYGLASDAALVQLLDRVRTPFNVNQAAQAAALAAWGDEDFMQRGVAETVRLRDVLAQRLAAPPALPALRIAPSAANFLFIDIGRPNGPVNEALLARGLIVKPWKEPGFEHFIRVSVGTEADNERFVRALAEILEAVQ